MMNYFFERTNLFGVPSGGPPGAGLQTGDPAVAVLAEDQSSLGIHQQAVGSRLTASGRCAGVAARILDLARRNPSNVTRNGAKQPHRRSRPIMKGR